MEKRPFAWLYRQEVLLGRLVSDRPDRLGCDAVFLPSAEFEGVRHAFEAAEAGTEEDSFEQHVGQLRLSLVFDDGTRTGEFVLRLRGDRARVSWNIEQSRESGE